MITMSDKRNTYQPNWGGPENSPSSEPSRWRIVCHPRFWSPPTDVFETEDSVVIRVEIAGMQEGDLSISCEDRLLTVRGVRPDTLLERRAYLRMEVPFGEFRTDVDLPYDVESHAIKAEYRDGFLHVFLPKVDPRNLGTENQNH